MRQHVSSVVVFCQNIFCQNRGHNRSHGHLDRGTSPCRPHVELPQTGRKLWNVCLMEPDIWALYSGVSAKFSVPYQRWGLYRSPTKLLFSHTDCLIIDSTFLNTNKILWYRNLTLISCDWRYHVDPCGFTLNIWTIIPIFFFCDEMIES